MHISILQERTAAVSFYALKEKNSIEIMYLGFRCGKFFVVVFER